MTVIVDDSSDPTQIQAGENVRDGGDLPGDSYAGKRVNILLAGLSHDHPAWDSFRRDPSRFRVDRVDSLADALRTLRQCPPHIVVIDTSNCSNTSICTTSICSPGEFLAAVKADPAVAGVPVIVITARDDAAERVKALVAGAADALSHPFHPDELLARVDRLLRVQYEQEARAEYLRRLETESTRDPVTGLSNARMLIQRLDQEASRADRYSLVVSCILLQVEAMERADLWLPDDQTEDTLRRVATVLTASARSSDLLAHIGSGRFAVMLPQAGPREAFDVAERIQGCISEVLHSDSSEGSALVVSAGVASFPGGLARDGASVLENAQRALGRARLLGKNRAVMANPESYGMSSVEPIEAASARILIVEDEPNNQILIQKILSRMGYDWVCVGDGAEAVSRVASREFALVLLDLSLPGMDGWEATRRIRESGNDVPIVATSAHAMAVDKERAVAVGCNEFVTKPFNLPELRRTIQKYVPLPEGPGN